MMKVGQLDDILIWGNYHIIITPYKNVYVG